MNSVEYSNDSGLGIITLQDGKGGNRLNLAILTLIHEAFDEAEAASDVRVIILRSAEEAFCLGMDLGNLSESLAQEAEKKEDAESADDAMAGTVSETMAGMASNDRKKAIALYGKLLERIVRVAKPVIALIDGAVKAGGTGLVSACDIVLGTERASFELSEALFGLIPANVLPFLVKTRISIQKAKYLILTAALVEAEEALQIGMLDQLFPSDQFEKSTKRILRTMLRLEAGALAETKSFIVDSIEMSHGEFRSAAEDKLYQLMNRPEVQEGIAAISNGEMPPWALRLKPADSITNPRKGE